MAELLWFRDDARPGAENMARDRAVWQHCEADPDPGVRLRLYRWRPAALSLGFHQPEEAVDRPALARRGHDLVRRPTGGAAVLHDEELTYCVVAPLGTPGLGRAVLEIHDSIAEALSAAFRRVGISLDRGGDGVPRDFACFSGAGGHEMTLGGRKVVGSALRRGRRAFLQHGSILLGESHLELCGFMAGSSVEERARAREALASKTTVLTGLDESAFAAALADELAGRCGLDAREVARFDDLLPG